MALSKRIVIKNIRVETDGVVHIFEDVEVWDGGSTNGTMIASTKAVRTIQPGDKVAAGEDQLVKDVINGNVHSAERKAARRLEPPRSQPIPDIENQ